MTTTTHLDEAIEQEKRRAKKRIDALRRKREREQRRIHDVMITLLRERDPGAYEALHAEAIDVLDAERAERAARARRARQGDGGDATGVEHPGGVQP